ncbi:MAG: hypothetical protein BIFFINMI_03956 [Phycisphaerae bacterium]|nr:hypothetical protein [Phycisphaerae bacterium]
MYNQRIRTLLEGGTPDRLPWAPEINEGFARKLTGKPPGDATPYRHIEREAARRIGADYLHRIKSVKVVRHAVEEVYDPATGVRVYRTPAGELREHKTWDSQSGTHYAHEHLVKGPESYDAYRAMIEDETFEPAYEQAAVELAESDLPTIDVPATPLMHLLMWDMGVQELLMAMMTDPDPLVDLMQAIHRKNLEYYRVAAAGPGMILRPMEDTSSRLTGPRMYREHCVAWLNDYADVVHGAGKTFLVHMCGHLGGPMPDVLSEIRLDGIEAITPPPLGDADLARLRETLGDIWLVGGVDPSLYATASVDQIAAHVGRTLETMRNDRRFILGHEEIPLAAKLENVKAVADLVAATADGFYA